MRPSGRRVLWLATPLRVLIQRFALVLLVGAAIGLVVLGRAEPVVTERLRLTVTDAAAPVLEFVSRPAAAISGVVERIDNFFSVYSENDRLRQENERLMQWQMVARRLEHENSELRGMLNVISDPGASLITARVIADSGGAFVRTVLINAGTRDGVAAGQAVITDDGLIGRIVGAGKRSARVLLLTDLNSRIPVVIEASRAPAILAGDNTSRPHLIYLTDSAKLAVGDRVVTSGQGGMFPPGLPIGIVSEVSGGEALVQPFAGWNGLEFVNVLHYAVPGILPATGWAERIWSLP